jgi:drug/metabolite transporter (DMT)-like permease
MWVALAVTAACLQTGRNALARSLSGGISSVLNSWSRFAFNLPFSSLLVGFLVWRDGWPGLTWRFYAFCLATALTQLGGNVALVAAFRRGNFAQSIVLHKFEVAFAALVGFSFFGERPNVWGWAGVLACAAGVLLMNLGRQTGPQGWRRAFHLDRGALLALLCAFLLVLAGFFLKAATAEFASVNPWVGQGRFEAAAHTLFHTTWMEVVVLSAWLLRAEVGAFAPVGCYWRRMLAIGFTGFCGSLCWFWSYSLTLVAYVKAVGQVESLFAVVLGIALWREREVWRQLPGVALVLAGIALVLLG